MRNAALDVTAEHGLAPVTMSQIAKQTGIGCATRFWFCSMPCVAAFAADPDRYLIAAGLGGA